MRSSPIALDPAALDRAHCPNCHCEITRHQPDKDLPDRLLGTCEVCKSWFLMDAGGQLLFAMPPRKRRRPGD
jgi:hypothetical protein